MMDPNETLRLARSAMRDGRARDAARHYADLAASAYAPEAFSEVTCRLCGEPLHKVADTRLDEFVYVGRDGKQTGHDADVAHFFDPARNWLGASNPYDALMAMADLIERATKPKKACLTPLYWTTAREYSALRVRLDMGMSFHVHRPDTRPAYTGDVPPYHCGLPMWLRPSGWHCRQCKKPISEVALCLTLCSVSTATASGRSCGTARNPARAGNAVTGR